MLHGIRQTMLIPVDLFHTSAMLWEIIRFWRNDRNLTKNIPVCWFDEAEFA